jgi:hypothetical protein
MKWVRSNIKQDSRLALFALAVQFVLAFGHFHGVAQAAPAIQSGPAQSESSTTSRLAAPHAASPSAQQQQPASDRDSDQQPGDRCPICSVIALASPLHASAIHREESKSVSLIPTASPSEFVETNLSAAFLGLGPWHFL